MIGAGSQKELSRYMKKYFNFLFVDFIKWSGRQYIYFKFSNIILTTSSLIQPRHLASDPKTGCKLIINVYIRIEP